jgi:hypothetical protein
LSSRQSSAIEGEDWSPAKALQQKRRHAAAGLLFSFLFQCTHDRRHAIPISVLLCAPVWQLVVNKAPIGRYAEHISGFGRR